MSKFQRVIGWEWLQVLFEDLSQRDVGRGALYSLKEPIPKRVMAKLVSRRQFLIFELRLKPPLSPGGRVVLSLSIALAGYLSRVSPEPHRAALRKPFWPFNLNLNW